MVFTTSELSKTVANSGMQIFRVKKILCYWFFNWQLVLLYTECLTHLCYVFLFFFIQYFHEILELRYWETFPLKSKTLAFIHWLTVNLIELKTCQMKYRFFLGKWSLIPRRGRGRGDKHVLSTPSPPPRKKLYRKKPHTSFLACSAWDLHDQKDKADLERVQAVYGVQLQCRLYWFHTQKFSFTATRKAQVEWKYLSGFIVMPFTLKRCQ